MITLILSAGLPGNGCGVSLKTGVLFLVHLGSRFEMYMSAVSSRMDTILKLD